jgi:tetratricopeptide (TPR) repeat protein
MSAPASRGSPQARAPGAPNRPPAGWVGALACALALCVASLPALGAGFVYDDRLVVLRNPAVAAFDLGELLGQPMWAFYGPGSEPEVGFWRPLASLAHALVWSVAGPSAAAFHALSLALHLLACAAAWRLARRLLRDDVAAMWTALLFGLHPVHVESLAWISAVGDPLYAALGLLAIERHLAWRERGARGSPWAAGGLFLLALCAKELAAGVLLAAVAIELARGDRRPLARAWLPWIRALGAWWALRALVFASPLAGFDRTTTDFGVSAARLLLLRVELLGGGLALLAWPAKLTLFRPFVPEPGWREVLVPLLALGAWVALAVAAARRRARTLLALLLLALAPLAALVVRVGSLGLFPLSERYLYLAAFGFAAALVWAARGLLSARWAALALSVLALGFGIRSHEQARVWRDEETLFRAAAQASPRSPYARRQIGRVLLERYRVSADPAALREAEREFQAGLALLEASQKGDGTVFAVRDDHVQTNVGMGWVLAYQAEAEGEGDFGPARAVFELVVGRYPESEEGWTGLGVAQLRGGDLEAAQRSFERALAQNERFVEAHRNRGRLALRRGAWAEARRSFERALELQPDHVETLLLLASAHERAGDESGAMRQLERASALAPRSAAPIVGRASLVAKAGLFEEAERLLDSALALEPDSAQAHLELGKVRAARGA